MAKGGGIKRAYPNQMGKAPAPDRQVRQAKQTVARKNGSHVERGGRLPGATAGLKLQSGTQKSGGVVKRGRGQ